MLSFLISPQGLAAVIMTILMLRSAWTDYNRLTIENTTVIAGLVVAACKVIFLSGGYPSIAGATWGAIFAVGGFGAMILLTRLLGNGETEEKIVDPIAGESLNPFRKRKIDFGFIFAMAAGVVIILGGLGWSATFVPYSQMEMEAFQSLALFLIFSFALITICFELHDGFGGGDIKVLCVLALWFGYNHSFLNFLFMAVSFGFVLALLHLPFSRPKLRDLASVRKFGARLPYYTIAQGRKIPYAIALAPAAIIAMMTSADPLQYVISALQGN